jgi:glycosyltransferase involved in cell wall biosynthesis
MKTVLCLGRWEATGYKNSAAAFEVLRHLSQPVALLVLEQAENIQVPSDLLGQVFPIGFPDDAELKQVMLKADAGISMSLWEGFNLPLAEMQWLGRPALAFSLAAHPEVVAHPWYLCGDAKEMAAKLEAIFRGEDLEPDTKARALDRFRAHFTWERFANSYCDLFEKLVRHEELGAVGDPVRGFPEKIVIDVTNSCHDAANSGVVRVTRRLSRTLQETTDPLFVVWDSQNSEYLWPTHDEFRQLSEFNGPVLRSTQPLSGSFKGAEGAWLLMPESKPEAAFRTIRNFAHGRRMRVAAVFYDSIPLLRPDLCNEEVRTTHGDYMRGLAECDVVIPISVFSATCLRTFWQEQGIRAGALVIPNLLPGEFGGSRRSLESKESRAASMLCVSTLEPRKNHRNLIQACLLMEERHPDLDWSLTLIGNRYQGAFDIADFVEETAARNRRIKWLGIVEDAVLEEQYQAAAFTVYPSVIEGFGLPIVESIWHGKPCICSCDGVMGELALEGGCLTTHVENVEELYRTIWTLATDDSLLQRLTREAQSRTLKTWNDYAEELLQSLRGAPKRPFQRAPALSESRPLAHPPASWQESLYNVLYPECLRDHWQMHDSERMAVTALLSRLKPVCSIEIGTYMGGSLSLISQFSQIVFSIDIEPVMVPSRENVSFLTGPSEIVLPKLLNELDEAGVAPHFILIDADHSTEGVKRDIKMVLDYVPREPLFVMLHDSFNPECRRGMLDAGWSESPYCHFIDVDFVPGRVVEVADHSFGELWGGLALAYFSPVPREGDLRASGSANTLFRVMRDWREGNTIAAHR